MLKQKMIKLLLLLRLTVTTVICFLYALQTQAAPAFDSSHSYFISAGGNDNNDGSLQHPWKTLNKVNHTQLQPGDVVNLHSGDTLNGTLQLTHIYGKKNQVIIIRSYGKRACIINAKDSSAIILDSCFYLSISNIKIIGSGRKEGNTKDGAAINHSHYISVDNIEVSGFQKSGLLIYNSKNIAAGNVYAHDNGFAGIYVSGEYGDKLRCRDINIINCHAENNPGDPTNFGNHSGNGILAGFCTNVLIDSCVANNNGWDMPRKGNGPVGIWCFEADSVIIQHCISYENKTSKGGEDGGGYDFDGGTTNSVIQYCLSYRNQGSGFGIFQYNGASPWHDNVIRWCISENDGNVSAAHANAYVWNSLHDSSQFRNFLFYNNTLYNDKNAALSYSTESEHSNFRFYNNIFVAIKNLVTGNYADDIFGGNDWWNLRSDSLISGSDFISSATHSNKEHQNNNLQETYAKPLFINAGKASLTKVSGLSSFTNYQMRNASTLRLAGIDLQQLFNLPAGSFDFNHLPVKKKGIGACLKLCSVLKCMME